MTATGEVMEYQEFLERKIISDPPTGLTETPELTRGPHAVPARYRRMGIAPWPRCNLR